MRKTVKILIPKKSQPYSFKYFLTHYVFQPWVREGSELVRLFRLTSGKFVLVRVGFQGKSQPKLTITLQSKAKLIPKEEKFLVDMIAWIFGVNEEVREFYEVICPKDPVLKAASEEIYGAHLRTDPYVFESVIGVVLAQNVQFQRIYKMSELLCQKFGESRRFGSKTYYTFPTPSRLALAKLSEIRQCKVGYRDKYIKGIAQKIVREQLNLDALREIEDTAFIRKKLLELPGVGPYTADLAIAIGFRKPTFHLDLFSREAMYTFYFHGQRVSDEEIQAFVEKKWGRWKHHVMLLLTTNTDTWAQKLGKNFRLKSGAQQV